MSGFDLFLLITAIAIFLLCVLAVLDARLEKKQKEVEQNPEPSPDWQWPHMNGKNS